jgi:hypothetical protein
MKQATIHQQLLSNGSTNKHVSMGMTEHSNNGREVFYTIHAEVLQPGPVSNYSQLVDCWDCHCELLLLEAEAGDSLGTHRKGHVCC